MDAPAPAPIVAAPAPAVATAQPAANESGFNSWLNNMTGNKDTAATTVTPPAPVSTADNSSLASPPEDVMASAPVPLQAPASAPVTPDVIMAAPQSPMAQNNFAPADPSVGKEVAPGVIVLKAGESAPPVASSQPVNAVALGEPVNSTPAPDIALLPQNSQATSQAETQTPQPLMPQLPPAEPMTASVAPQPIQPDQASAMEPVHLHPPTSMESDNAYVAPASQPLGQNLNANASMSPVTNNPAPVTLSPPSMHSGSQTRYLADSRYLDRRMRNSDYDSDSN
jgi:hypothetical protein